MLYTDNGPIAKSQVFQNVMDCLGVKVVTHLPNGKDGRRVTARSKGKVERPFRTIKEAHETLYHFYPPETEAEANRWLHQYLLNYNNQPHHQENHSRMEDWCKHIPKTGLQQMCSWERFCTFARESEQFNAKPAEIRSLFRGQLEPSRSRELQEQMLAAGLSL